MPDVGRQTHGLLGIEWRHKLHVISKERKRMAKNEQTLQVTSLLKSHGSPIRTGLVSRPEACNIGITGVSLGF